MTHVALDPRRAPVSSRTLQAVGPAAAPPVSVAERPALTGQLLARRYRVEERIGAGGSATVYRGRHVVMDQEVAIKVLDGDARSQGREVARFLAEARALAKLRHPNIVRVHDFACSGELAWMAMELLEGETLADRCDKLGRLPPSSVRRIILQLCSALAAVHEAGFIHRDVTPGNLLCIPHMSDPDFVKLVDFGIAAVRTGEEIRCLLPEGIVAGTPHYMAPERLWGADDERGDVYAVGVVMYELLTGTLPFDGPTPQAILSAHADTPIEPPSMRTPGCCSREIDRVVERAMAKSPDDRYGSMRELTAAIRRAWQAPQPTVVFEASPVPRPPVRQSGSSRSPRKPATVIVPALEPSTVPPPKSAGVVRRALLTLVAGVTLAVATRPLLGSSRAGAVAVDDLAAAAARLVEPAMSEPEEPAPRPDDSVAPQPGGR